MLAGIGDSARKLQSGYEDQLARVARAIRRAIEVRVDLVHDEAGPRQQVLGLETKDAAHLEGMDEALLTAVGVGDVVDELAGIDRLDQVAVEHSVPPEDGSPIGKGEGRLLVRLRTVGRLRQIVDRRVEDIEHEATLGSKMATYRAETGELIVHRDQVLERAEWNRHQAERSPEV